MPIDQLAVLIIFFVLNIAIIFLIKTPTSTVISLIISHLVVVLFLSISMTNYSLFKEVVLMLIVYSMVILFLISNNKSLLCGIMDFETKRNKKSSVIYFLSIIPISILFFLSVFFMVKKIPVLADKIYETKLEIKARINDSVKNPELSKDTESVSSLSKIIDSNQSSGTDSNFISKDEDSVDKLLLQNQIKERERLSLKAQLSENFLFKHFSDAVLIIVAQISILLLLSNKRNRAR